MNSSSFLFLDPCALTAALTLVEQFGTTNTTSLVQDDRVDVGREEGEQTLYAYAVRDLTHRKGSGSTLALQLDHIAFKGLDTLLVTFNNLIVHSDIITSFELGEFFFASKLLVDKCNSVVHNFKI